jgi:aminopeptidase N
MEKQRLKDYKAPNYFQDNVNIEFDILEDYCIVNCKSELSIRTEAGEQFLNAKELELLSIKLDDRDLVESKDYILNDQGLLLKNLETKHQLEIKTKIYPHKNKSLEGLYKTSDFYCTQNEAQGFRRITYFIDRPDNLASYTCHIIADKNKYPVLLSNGDRIGEEELEDNRKKVSWKDPHKKPCYLFALVAGNLSKISDQYITKSGRKVLLEIYSEEKYLDRLDFAMQSLKDSMKWDEDTYGLEYDLDTYMIVVSDDFNAGAMENKGLNIFNSKYVLASPESATENAYYLIQSVIGHEYFHNWSGNRVTCRDWFQLSLKEGLTVYRDQEFTSDLNSPAVKRIEDVKMLRARQFPEDNGPNSHPVRPEEVLSIDNFYSATIYEKGAEIIRMYNSLMGDKSYKKAVSEYFKKFDGTAATCDDFLKCMEEGSGLNLQHFKKWYSQSGTPRVTIEESYDKNKNLFTIELSQNTPPTNNQKQKEALYIPIRLAFFNDKGEKVKVNHPQIKDMGEEYLFVLDKDNYTLEIKTDENLIGSYFRNFSAPVITQRELKNEQLLLLAKYDDDAFNQFEAIEQLKQKHLINLYEANNSSQDHIDALKELLANYKQDPAFTALCLNAPSISYLLLSRKQWDYEKLKTAGKQFSEEIAISLNSEFYKIYGELDKETKGKNGLQYKGLKDLKNSCLYYLGLANHPEAKDLSKKQFENNSDMTNQLGALVQRRFLNEFEPQDDLFSAFKEKWKTDKLVINDYIRLLCGSGFHIEKSYLEDLFQEDFFDKQNPNNLYSSLAAFASNFNLFHANWQWSYAFVIEKVLEIDKFNAQVAGRLMQQVENWERFDEAKKSKMAELLKNINLSTCSSNLREIIENNLKLI